MKNTKRIISLILTIQLLLACTLIPSAIATDSVMEEPIDAVEAPVTDEGESSEELSPMMESGCTGTYIPPSWTVDTTHTGSSIGYGNIHYIL